MPGTLPIEASAVVAELTNYLDEAWTPVIATDVDGENALPLRLDNENPTFGRYSAARRVARTVFMGSAPIQEAANRGVDDRRIKLGCVQPGESPATFGDALRRLANEALYPEHGRTAVLVLAPADRDEAGRRSGGGRPN